MSRPTKNEYLMAVDAIRNINRMVDMDRKNIDRHLDSIIEIKRNIDVLEEAKKRNEEMIMRYKLYEEKEGVKNE